MKIVIDIPEMAYEAFKEWHKNKAATVEQSLIAQGTPLPKGHGRLIDENEITKCEQIGSIIKDGNVRCCFLTDAPTIIEEDKEEEV